MRRINVIRLHVYTNTRNDYAMGSVVGKGGNVEKYSPRMPVKFRNGEYITTGVDVAREKNEELRSRLRVTKSEFDSLFAQSDLAQHVIAYVNAHPGVAVQEALVAVINEVELEVVGDSPFDYEDTPVEMSVEERIAWVLFSR